MRHIQKREKKYKDFLKWRKRVDILEEMLSKLPLIPLDKPQQEGWQIYLELTPEAARRDDAFDLQQLIDIGFSDSPYSYLSDYTYISKTSNIKYVKLIRKGETSYSWRSKGKYHSVSFRPPRRHLSENEYLSLPPNLSKYFDFDSTDKYYIQTGRKRYRLSYKFPDHFTQLKVRPYFVTHYQSRGGVVEKERDYLRSKIHEYFQLNGSGYDRDDLDRLKGHCRTQTRSDIRKVIKGELEDISGKYKKY